MVRTARTWPCSLKRARNSCAASRSAAGRSPRGHSACASSNSWKGRIPTVSGLSMAAMSQDYVDLTCVIHLHSTYSDGTGTVAQIARAASRAGVDVVLLTDHDTLAGEEGWYDDVLVLVGEEVTPPDRDHYLAFDIEKRISPRLTGPEICAAVQAQGGFGFAAHPWSQGNPRFKRGGYPGGDFSCLEGVEVWSFLNDTGEKLSGFTDIARMIFAPQSIIGGPPEHNL